MKQPIVLRIFKGDKLEAVRQFDQNQIVIGRGGDVQLTLADDSVALLHAMIEDRNGDYYISDLGSQSGTFVNGQRTLEERLTSGAQLTIGAFKIQFSVGVPRTATVNAPPPLPSLPIIPEKTSSETPVSQAVTFAPIVNEIPAPKAKTHSPQIPTMKPASPAPSKSAAAYTNTGTKTFAPPSPYKNLSEIVRPQKGSVTEVIVAWKDRILSTRTFSDSRSIYISSGEDADVIIPILTSTSKYELLRVGPQTTLCLTQEMTGEVISEVGTQSFAEMARQNKIRNAGSHYEIDLRQGEMARVGLMDDLISIYIRYVPSSPKPMLAPIMDLASSEATGVMLALAISVILALYMNIYTPSQLLDDEAKIDEPIRKAIVTFTPPPKHEEKTVVEVVDKPKENKAIVKEQPRQTPTPSVEKKGDPGKASDVAPKPDKNKEKKYTSARPGGAIKTSPKEGASAKSEKPDPSKVGLLSAFSSKGAQSKLDKAYSGSGELQGMADQATGYAGNADNRDGENLGTKLKDTGAGGKGSSTVGIAGLGTSGRGTGTTGYGSGGIGQKGSVQINAGGQEGEFSGGMDKEAIRRVIREHLREIKNCYDRELQHTPDMYGKLVLEWDIETAGKATNVKAKSNALGNDTVANCIMARLQTWKFPDPPKNAVGHVSAYPFVFESK